MSKVRKALSKLGVIPVLVVLFIILSFTSPYFLQVSNIINILHQVSITAIIGVGMTFVILTVASTFRSAHRCAFGFDHGRHA
jgi:ribose/xylose/arabinose/galactoside ABC-type transport system permease subunit